MKALRWHGPRDLRLVDLVEPPLQHGELRIGVAYCGICGSDLHEYVDGPHAIPVEHRIRCRVEVRRSRWATSSAARCSSLPTVGHRRRHARRDRAGIPLRAVRVLPQGRYNLCRSMGFVGLMGDGGDGRIGRRPAYTAHALPDAVRFEQAAVFEPAAVALHAVRRSGLQPGDDCVVSASARWGC